MTLYEHYWVLENTNDPVLGFIGPVYPSRGDVITKFVGRDPRREPEKRKKSWAYWRRQGYRVVKVKVTRA